uniref:Uncharacterized protein n=1 Tax=Timema genevievae TaxID=629358 RepID=A0A7R9JMV3_TIMGE|nr:unnamed protein product [Timema genevievae]
MEDHGPDGWTKPRRTWKLKKQTGNEWLREKYGKMTGMEEDIPDDQQSPFQLKVRPHIEPHKVTVEGIGVSGKGIPASIPAEFTIDTNQAGYGDLDINVKRIQDIQLEHVKDKITAYEVWTSLQKRFEKKGTTSRMALNKKLHIMRYRLSVEIYSEYCLKFDKLVQELKTAGELLNEEGIVINFLLTMPDELEGVVSGLQMLGADKMSLEFGPDGYPRKVKLTDNGDSTFKASYIPDDCGRYKVSVKYGGKEVPHSPFQVQAVATGSADKCKITEGIQQTLTSGEEYCITVNTKNAGYGAVTCRIRSTSGRTSPASLSAVSPTVTDLFLLPQWHHGDIRHVVMSSAMLRPPLNENDKSLITLGHSCWDGRGSTLSGFTGVGFPVQGRQISWDNLQIDFLEDVNNCCFTSCILSSIILGRHLYVDPPSFPFSPASSPSSKWWLWLVVYANQIYSDTPSDIIRKNRSPSTDAQ